MTVIEHDFGSRARRTVRRFRELLALDPLHEANIRANPVPYLERAGERIFQLERALFEAVRVFERDQAGSGETVLVDKAEYERLLRCRAVVEKALSEYARDQAF